MHFSLDRTGQIPSSRTAVAIGLLEDGPLSPTARAIDEASGGLLERLRANGTIDGRASLAVPLLHVPGVPWEKILVIGCGNAADFGPRAYTEAVGKAIRLATDFACAELACAITELSVNGRDIAWALQYGAEAAGESAYRFDQLKKKPATARPAPKEVAFVVTDANDAGREALTRGRAVVEGMTLMRDLANLPGNHCTPTHLAREATALGARYGLPVTVLEETQMQALGMGALLSVTRGSREPAKLITIEYQAGGPRKPVVLVGKGVTFDSGGISIKPAAAMDEMKFDMSGAASVLGTIKAVAEMKLPINLVGVIPTCENLPDGHASKPGDVVTTMSGQTVEILNTDAEGRLILCDALTYSERFEPEVVVDIATLTGACVIALGSHAAGLFSGDDALAAELLAAGERAHDRAWRMPLWEDYQKQLDSNFADMANIGGREAGSVTAACFLARFTKKFRWAHLDIAGVAYRGGKQKGSTARPVPLLTEFLIGRSGAPTSSE